VIEVVNGRSPALRMGPDGRPAEEIRPGELLYRGPAQMCAASTVPFYGYGLRMFPHACHIPGTMQLRVANVPTWTILSHLSSVWNGTFTHPQLHDFLVEEVEVRSREKLPLQVGGDAEGFVTSFEFRLAPRSVELV